MGKIEKGQELTEQVNGYIAELQEQLAAGHSQAYIESLEFFSRFHDYSFANAMLILAQRENATLVAGYNQWAEMGYTIRRGEKGISIRAPWLRKDEDPQTGEKKQKLIGYIGVYVFDVSQCNEYPDKQPPAKFGLVVPEGDFEGLYTHLWMKISRLGYIMAAVQLPNHLHGFYSPKGPQITVNSTLSWYEKATCLIHEYVHAVAHPTKEEIVKWTKEEREYTAESVAFVVCRCIGVEHPTARDYLLGYRLTTDKLGDMVREIQTLTKRVISDLQLKPEAEKETESVAAD